MIIAIMAGLTLVVFTSRYLFLEPRLPLKLGPKTLKFLGFSTPAVLTAIIGPIIFVQDKQLVTDWSNAYLIGAVVAVVLILLTKRVLLTAVVSMGVFLLLH